MRAGIDENVLGLLKQAIEWLRMCLQRKGLIILAMASSFGARMSGAQQLIYT